MLGKGPCKSLFLPSSLPLCSFSLFPLAKSRRRGPLAQPRLLEFRSRPPPLSSEANESETSRVCGHPCPTRLIAVLLLALWPGRLWVSGKARIRGRAWSGRLPCHGQSGDVTLLCDTRHALVTWKPKAEAGGEKILPGFPAPQSSPVLV